jgi:hypothetical protein
LDRQVDDGPVVQDGQREGAQARLRDVGRLFLDGRLVTTDE